MDYSRTEERLLEGFNLSSEVTVPAGGLPLLPYRDSVSGWERTARSPGTSATSSATSSEAAGGR